tara:strand:+ start:1891 stop:2241 length:351 start_codon:yes stop_codon:yes gene_type:complete
MPNVFQDYGRFFSEALAANQMAARAETQVQEPGMAAERYTTQYDQLATQGPIPPQAGSYGVEGVRDTHTGTFPMDIKQDLLNRAKNKRRAAGNGEVELLAGGGIFHKGPKEQREDY